MAELWRTIPGYDGLYEISTLGNIRTWTAMKGFPARRVPSDTPRLLRPSVSYKSTRGVSDLEVTLTPLCGKKQRVRVKDLMRDVWMRGPRPGYGVVCKDKDPSNCALHNLVHVPMSETNKFRRGQYNRIPVRKIRAATSEVVTVYPTIKAASKANYISQQGMRHRIDKQLVCDGYIYQIDDMEEA